MAEKEDSIILLRLDTELKRRFKAHCSARGLSMTSYLKRLIKIELNDN